MAKSQFTLFALLAVLSTVSALDNGLGLTPQMGWNSWNKFACNVNETVIRQTADAIVKLGLDKLGYVYVNIDDCWSSGRDANNTLIPDPATFPSGIKALADYVHSLGLKLGIYSDAGFLTCAGRPGSLGFEDIDAQTWASWGIDYLKYDNCYTDGKSPKIRYPPMRDALNKSGRPIFFSMCEWGDEDPSSWAQSVGNSWRTTGDISATWDSVSIIYELQIPIANRSGPGGWNDPDMLEVGNGALTEEEAKTHFALWALLKAPLILGNDLNNIDNTTLSIISNADLISINQDKLGVSATLVQQNNGIDVWVGPLSDGYVFAVFNKNDQAASYTLDFSKYSFPLKLATFRDMMEQKDMNGIFKSVDLNIPSHGIKVIKATLRNKQVSA